MENQEFPKGVGFAPFLRSFMSNSSISIDELAVAMTMSKYAITRDRKSTRLNSSHSDRSRMPSSA